MDRNISDVVKKFEELVMVVNNEEIDFCNFRAKVLYACDEFQLVRFSILNGHAGIKHIHEESNLIVVPLDGIVKVNGAKIGVGDSYLIRAGKSHVIEPFSEHLSMVVLAYPPLKELKKIEPAR
jgi:quercetin dioxygenase-like cupin family protein